MKHVAVLIPCFNESQTIEKVVNDFTFYLDEHRQTKPFTYTIYVYDNNSTDQTAEIAAAAGANVRKEFHQGKGNVIRRMFREIEADCYLMVDGDDTYSAESAPEMIDLVLEKQADMVIGDRLSGTYFSENKRNFHNFGNSLVRYAINKLFRNDIKDIMTGYRAFSYAFVKTFPVLSRGFEIETEMTIHSVFRNMQVENVVIRYQDRPEGSLSKLNTLRDGARVLGTIVRLFKNYRPFAFFTFLAVVLFLVSVIFLIPVFVTYFQTGLVPRFPTLIVGGFLAICALLLFITGVILSTLLEQERRQFEFTRLQVDQWQKAKRNRAKDVTQPHE